MLTRRTFACAALASAASVALPFARAQSRPEKTRLSIAVGGKGSFAHLPLTVSEQLGFFKAEGIDVEITDFVGGTGALQALGEGSADVVSCAFEHVISLQARGEFLQAFVLQGRAPQVAVGVSTRALPDYRNARDLRGKRIGVSAPGSSTNTVVNIVLSRVGVRTSEVSYIGVGQAAGALAALRSGEVQAMSNTDPVMWVLEQRGEVRIISDTRTLKGTYDVFGGPMPASCLAASFDFVRRHPNTCQALTHAIVRGLKWLQTAGPSDIIKAVPEPYLMGDRALYLASFNKVREAIALDGVIPDEGVKTALKALATFESDTKAAKIDLAKTYTNEFARRAKERFSA